MENIKNKELREVPLSDIKFEDLTFCSRKDLNLDDLAKSLEQDRQHVPVELRELNGQYQIISGFRRCNALKKIGKKTVLALVHQPDEDEIFLHKISLIENLQRDSLSDLEKVDACTAMYKRGMSKKELATIYNVVDRSIETYIRISTQASDKLKSAINEGIMTLHQVVPLIGQDETIIELAIKEAKKGNFSVTRARKLVNKRTRAEYTKPVSRMKKFKHGFNLNIRFRLEYDKATKLDVKKKLQEALKYVESDHLP